MPKTYPYVNSFNAGELSELLYNREDITKYRSGCRVLENAFPLVEGGAKKMPGTYFAGPTINGNTKSRLVSFQFSTAQGAFLELSAGIIRIWSPTAPGSWTLGLVESGGSPIQLATPYAESDLFDLDCGTQSADVLWIFHPSYPPACVERQGPSTWSYTTNPPGRPPVGPGNSSYRGTPDVVTTGASGLGSPIIQMTQADPLVLITDRQFSYGDRIYINLCAGMVELNQGEFFVQPALNPTDIAQFTGKITGGTSTQPGTILDVSAVASGTILVGMLVTGGNVTPSTFITEYLTGTGGTGTYQVTTQQLVGGGTGMTGKGGFCYNLVKADTGALFTGSISTTTLTVTAVAAGIITLGMAVWYPGAAPLYIQSFGTGTGGVGTYTLTGSASAGSQRMMGWPIFSSSFLPYQGGGFAVKVVPFFDATNKYPACGTFYQGRLCVGGANNTPNQLNGSVIQDFPDFISDPNADDYAIQFTLLSTLLDQIVNIIGTPAALLVGTAGGVWAMSGGSPNSTALSQTSVNVSKQTTIGVGKIAPQLCGDSAVFISRTSRQVMFLVYDFVSNQWNNYDLTRLNRQITIAKGDRCSGVKQTAFQSEPYPIFWAVRSDGQLLGLVFNKQDQVFAWFRINMQPNGGDIESVAVISGQDQEDMIGVVVNRTVSDATVRYVEYFYPQELFNQLNNAFFVHCGLKLDLGDAVNITNITNSNPCVVTAPGHNYANGNFVQISGVIGDQGSNTGMWQVNQDKTEAYTVANANIGAGTFELSGVDSSSWGPYLGGGTSLRVTNTVTGMSYLMGNTVTAVGDGAIILPPSLVTNDSITFMYYCAKIAIGIPYRMTVQPTNPILSQQGSTTRGQKQKLNRVTISLYQSLGGKYGVDLSHMYDITYGPGTQGGQP